MVNPLPVNATLIFQVPAPLQVPVLDESGNKVIPTQDLTCNCYLKPSKRQIQPQSDMGATDYNLIPLEGYVISIDGLDPAVPQVLPNEVRGGARAQATFIGEWQQEGEFILDDDVPSAFSTQSFGVSIEGILGRKLKGYLNVTIQWGN